VLVLLLLVFIVGVTVVGVASVVGSTAVTGVGVALGVGEAFNHHRFSFCRS
jgi:hypothetical protein